MITLHDFTKISDFEWEIPRTYRKDMRVPVRIFATRTLLEDSLDDLSMEQAINASMLPGVVGAVCVMPDMHQGYGFPIGGVAAMRYPDGVISPGAIGYDINCLSGDTKVLHADGYNLPIAEYASRWQTDQLTCFQLGGTATRAETALQNWFGRKPSAHMLRLVTDGGQTITATADHPVWTPQGMVELERLHHGDRVAIYPFEGLPFEAPSADPVITEERFSAFLRRLGKSERGNALPQVLNSLRDKGLLSLSYASPQTPILCKLLGFLFGDGTVHFTGGKGMLSFYGETVDLEEIRKDILKLGFSPSRIWQRKREHKIQTTYQEYRFVRTEYWVSVNSTALAGLFVYLGLPVGNKADQPYDLPAWLEVAPRWQKRLFLAGLFGAELSAPSAMPKHPANFAAPVLSMNKRSGQEENGRQFLEHIGAWLEQMGIATRPIAMREEQVNRDGSQSLRLRLIVEADLENMIALYSRIGFVYNQKRHALAAAAVAYLRLKQAHVHFRETVIARSQELALAGVPPQDIYQQLAGPRANRRFIERSLYEIRRTSPRIGSTFPGFMAFREEATAGLGDSGMVWACIERIENVDDVDLVYDFTVIHPDHNFVANQVVVSNCGVRLLASSILYDQAAPYLDQLASALDHYCPSGMGAKNVLTLTDAELDQVCRQGAGWALKKGMATQEDLHRTEEGGVLEGADPRQISARAKERGRGQLGTLGSGNHFLEVDVVDQIYDEAAAQAMGLLEGTLCLSIHCGSRGFGHQVCTDFVSLYQSAARKYAIHLPDRELVCAPMNSPEGEAYLGAMRAAANFAFANRQVLAHQARRAFEEVLAGKMRNWRLHQVYDICHNIGKMETHQVDGQSMQVCVHRKGATRAFGPGAPGLPGEYLAIGQPVLVPGSMGTASWVLVGTETSMARSFGSSCHGAGRVMSRSKAKRTVRGEQLKRDLETGGIHVRAGSLAGLAEEAPEAYKDVDLVVETVCGAGIARKVARLRPVAVVKG